MNNFPTYDYAVHSDFLIHWTGKDIDTANQPDWYHEHHNSKTPPAVADLYLRRLSDILTFGLWMTDEGVRPFRLGTNTIDIPATPQCSFTELKLSESRRHAACYGRLGIGVKRPFVFQRYGRPLAYFGFSQKNNNDKFLEACASDLRDKRFLNFFKPMNLAPTALTYELYSESEWRILFFEDLLQQRRIIDPRDERNERENAYFKRLAPAEQQKLRYLIPLDGWFAMLIYPSLVVKNQAQWDANLGIADQIARIKGNQSDHGNNVEGLQGPIRGNKPIEIDLDSCRNF